MNWKNIDLKSNYEREQNIIDPYSFNQLLLEIHCNIKVINEHTVKEQFEKELITRINSAKEVFNNNLKNIVIQAKKERI